MKTRKNSQKKKNTHTNSKPETKSDPKKKSEPDNAAAVSLGFRRYGVFFLV